MFKNFTSFGKLSGILGMCRFFGKGINNKSLKFMKVTLKNKVALIRFITDSHFITLSLGLMAELNSVLKKLDKMKSIGAIVITGKENSFAAGANI